MKLLIALCVLWFVSLVIIKLRGKTFSTLLKAVMDMPRAKELATNNPISLRFSIAIMFAVVFTILPFIAIVWAIRELIG
jgi:hypothetical protein